AGASQPPWSPAQRGALPAAWADAVVRPPVGRELARLVGTRHHGPPGRGPRDDLDEIVRDFEGPAVDVEDGFEGSEARHTVPSPAAQRAVHVHLQTAPLHAGHDEKLPTRPFRPA